VVAREVRSDVRVGREWGGRIEWGHKGKKEEKTYSW